jgi:hypothetical protein
MQFIRTLIEFIRSIFAKKKSDPTWDAMWGKRDHD